MNTRLFEPTALSGRFKPRSIGLTKDYRANARSAQLSGGLGGKGGIQNSEFRTVNGEPANLKPSKLPSCPLCLCGEIRPSLRPPNPEGER